MIKRILGSITKIIFISDSVIELVSAKLIIPASDTLTSVATDYNI
jgi:hypothetical protein